MDRNKKVLYSTTSKIVKIANCLEETEPKRIIEVLSNVFYCSIKGINTIIVEYIGDQENRHNRFLGLLADLLMSYDKLVSSIANLDVYSRMKIIYSQKIINKIPKKIQLNECNSYWISANGKISSKNELYRRTKTIFTRIQLVFTMLSIISVK